MKDRISALMDGELDKEELEAAMRELKDGGDALETWRRYHLVSDAMRDTSLLSSGFSARLAERIEKEPTVLAPASIPARREGVVWKQMAVAATIVAGVGLVSFSYQNMTAPDPLPIAKNAPIERAKPATAPAVPMPGAANDYLLAHQYYSPRSSLQGVAPYVRTVSDSARPR